MYKSAARRDGMDSGPSALVMEATALDQEEDQIRERKKLVAVELVTALRAEGHSPDEIRQAIVYRNLVFSEDVVGDDARDHGLSLQHDLQDCPQGDLPALREGKLELVQA